MEWYENQCKTLESRFPRGIYDWTFARINLGSIYLEPALNFAHKESKINGEIGSIGQIKYSSIDIPVMVGYNILKLPVFKLRGFAGPVASFVTKDLKKDFNTDKMMWNGKIGSRSWRLESNFRHWLRIRIKEIRGRYKSSQIMELNPRIQDYLILPYF